jgi:hypothetical protein
MPEPLNKSLYEQVRSEIYKRIPQHSAYRSALIVQEYKRRGGKYSGAKQQKTGLKRWFAEKWMNQDGKIGYAKKGDIYRPTIRVTKDTPTTIHELTSKQIQNVMKEKKQTGHVKKFAS